jgi:hypothetical protein
MLMGYYKASGKERALSAVSFSPIDLFINPFRNMQKRTKFVSAKKYEHALTFLEIFPPSNTYRSRAP